MVEHSPILQKVWEHAASQPDKVALVWGDESVSYSQLKSRILSAAAALQSKGLNANDCLGMVAKKGLDFVYAYFGAQLIGVVNVVQFSEILEAQLFQYPF